MSTPQFSVLVIYKNRLHHCQTSGRLLSFHAPETHTREGTFDESTID